MFEPENEREKRREKPALLSIAGGPDRSRRKRVTGASVLDFGAAERKAREDAARRHQRARLARETRKENALLAGLADAEEPAPDEEDGLDDVLEDDLPRDPAPREDRVASGRTEQRQPDDIDDFNDRDTRAPDYFQPLIDPALLFGKIWSWRFIIAGLAVLGFVIGSAIALSIPHRYTAWSQILVDPREVKLVGRDIAPDFLANEAALAIIDSQLQLVYSPAVLSRVVEKANLDQDPEFNGTSESLGGVFQSIRGFMSIFSDANEVEERYRTAMRSLSDSIWAERTARTFVIGIGVTTQDPEKSALLANEVARAFIVEQQALQSDSAREASSALGGRLDTLRRDVEQAEEALENYRAENGLIGPSGRLVTDDQLAAVTAQLAQARADTIKAKSRAEAARSVDAAAACRPACRRI
jgi:succinoglycan biosynthesis transport protein ExoP